MWKKAKRWSDKCQDEEIEKIVKEIADVLEVLDAIKGCYGITDEEVMTIKNKKVSSNGAFNKKLFSKLASNNK